MKSINLRRTHLTLRPDPARVLARPLNLANEERAGTICRRVMALPEPEVRALLAQHVAVCKEEHLDDGIHGGAFLLGMCAGYAVQGLSVVWEGAERVVAVE